MAKLTFAAIFSFVLSAGTTMAEPIEWKATGGAHDLNYKLLGTRGNSLSIGGNIAVEGLLGITEHLATATTVSQDNFMMELTTGEELLGAIIEWITATADTAVGELDRLRRSAP